LIFLLFKTPKTIYLTTLQSLKVILKNPEPQIWSF